MADSTRVADAHIRYQIGYILSSRQLSKQKPLFHRFLGLTSDIDINPVRETFDTVYGNLQQKFNQFYKGIRVLGASINAEVEQPDIFKGGVIGGTVILDINKDVPNIYCNFTRTKAIKTVLQIEGLEESNILHVEVKPRQIITDDENKAHLVIVVKMLTESSAGIQQPHYFIDRCTGEIVKKFNKAQSHTTQTGTTETGTVESGTTKTGTKETGTTETGTTETGTVESGTTKTGTTESGTTETGTTETGTTESCTTEIGTTETGITETDTTEAGTTETGTTESGTTETGTTETGTTETGTAESGTTETGTTETGTTESCTTETGTTETGITETDTTEAGTTETGTTESGTTETGTTETGTTETGTTETGTTETGTTESGTTETGTTETGTTESCTTETGITETDTTEAGTTETGTTETGTTETDTTKTGTTETGTETGTMERGSTETGTTETSITETCTTETGTTETGTTETGTTETGTETVTTERGSTETGTTLTSTTETCTTETGTTETGTTESGTKETGITETSATETDITEAGTTETGTTETGTTEIDTTETSTTESGTTESGTTETAKPVYCGTAFGVGGNAKSGKYYYGQSPRCLNAKRNSATCFMENDYIITVDLKRTKDESKRDAIEFPCSSGYHDEVNGAYSPATDAFFHGTVAQKMLNEWYGINPLKKVAILVHYGKRVANAFWYKNAVSIGDGNNQFYPMTSLDAVAHEMGHGITDMYSHLDYDGEPGGIDESFSDIMGEATEDFFSTSDWMFAYHVPKQITEAVRYFDKPSRDGVSIDYATDYYRGIGVHHSSGVFNRAFYLIVKEYGLKMRYGFEAFLTANRIYWNSRVNFAQAACGVVRAAYDLGLDTEIFKSAFYEVHIVTCDITSYIRMLTAGTSRRKLKVSSIRQPLFGIRLQAKDTSITVATKGGNGIKVAISTSPSRSSSLVIGDGSVTWGTGGRDGTVYVRLFANNEYEQTGVTISLTKN